MPLVLKIAPQVNGLLPPGIPLFITHFTLEMKSLLNKNKTVAQIVMVSGNYGIWVCLLCQIEGCLLCKIDAGEFSKVLKVANGKHDIGRCILSLRKYHYPKNFHGALPPDLLS